MADYYPVISDAVSGLPSQTYEARRALYERARTALRKALRNRDPALSATELTKEQSVFEAAIRKVETELLFSEMRRDQEEYVALSAHKKFILTAKQFERSLRDNFNNNIKFIRDCLRANGTTLARSPVRTDEIISGKYAAVKIASVFPKIVSTKMDIAGFVQMTQLTAKNIGRRIRLIGKRS